ncbi:hypothetical protein [Pedobacter namyangjuensis]|uniref:hypothetical protein n=1 Tax=Pedobacter namyangjuensis TaxID=600626 RepID=UPI000DE2EC99|nr:hypothetical protein [Pedobacter namyangjuensis]
MAIALKKNLSLIATIVVILLVAIVGYYFLRLKQGPYQVVDFDNLTYKWGTGDTLENVYDAKTGNYQYLNAKDSLIKTNVKLRSNNIIYIHNKLNEIGFWSLPAVIKNKSAASNSVLRYEFELVYGKNRKTVIYYTDYDENQEFKAKAKEVQQLISQTIEEVESRFTR